VIQIGSEYGLINKPLPLDSLVVAPGERAEILIDFSKYAPGTKLVLENVDLPDGVVSPADPPITQIMQFTVTSGFGWPRKLIPAVLRPNNPILPLPRPANIKKRYVTLVEIMGAGGPCMALLNNRPFDTTDIEEVTVDTVEEWNIINTTADTHPIHLHLIGFQVAERQAFDVPVTYWRRTARKSSWRRTWAPGLGRTRHPTPSSRETSCRAGSSRPDGRTPCRSTPDRSPACSSPSARRLPPACRSANSTVPTRSPGTTCGTATSSTTRTTT